MANVLKSMLFRYSDIPIAYSNSKRNKTTLLFVYSDIPIAYPDGKRNNTNNKKQTDIPMAYPDCKRNKTIVLFFIF